jgi:tetratricopeptide (TPR) repeat protein
VSRIIKISLAAILAAGFAACRHQPEEKLCIAGDLGRYSLVSIEQLPGSPGGCRATYRDPHGSLVEVRVAPNRPDLFGDGGVPVPFEKHVVYRRRAGDGTLVGWNAGSTGVTVLLGDKAVPEGPVLRAYLFNYKSSVTAELRRTRKQVDILRQKSRRRPKDAAVHLELARKYRKLGDNVMAAQEYHISTDYDRQCFDCYLEMSTLYRELHSWDLAIRAARRAAGLRSHDPVPVVLLGDLFYDVHNGQEALRSYRAALGLGPAEKEAQRVNKRIDELQHGKYMIELLPGARKKRNN